MEALGCLVMLFMAVAAIMWLFEQIAGAWFGG
jgi:hypothetical protein